MSWVPGPTYELGPRSQVSGATFRAPGLTHNKGPRSWVLGSTKSPGFGVLPFGYGILKQFLLRNIKKWTLQKNNEKYDKNESKEGQTYKPGAF